MCFRTQIAFNVMRHSFDKQYIKKVIDDIMKDVTDCERNSKVDDFGSDQVIPQCVFDTINTGQIDQKQEMNGSRKFYGIVHTMQQRHRLYHPKKYQQMMRH